MYCAVRLMLMLFRALAAALTFAAGLVAQEQPSWTQPFPPHHVIGNVYYVGSKGLAAYLITTPRGNILINSNLESSVPAIRESVEKLGFKFSDTKILLISHAHWDHCAGSAGVKAATSAQYMVMDADVHDIEVIFVDEQDGTVNPMGIKGLGEIGIVGVAAAIANAV